ncbi:MAG: Rrf2 family transcriptional regulator [Bacteroidales bacterium]|nr:Rrf2 family transcriptional regulator [Bacteroidales bacterium]MCF8402841.1 Rrf2 family transcriptional regulator [Bacteroidales bacterium]
MKNTLFNISEGAAIALHCLAIIATSNENYNVNQLADKTRFSKNHLAKVMNTLVKNGLLDSERGPKGGFRLKEEKQKVSLFEILEVIDGKITKYECTVSCQACYFESCLFGEQPGNFSADFIHYLKNKTLSDFILKH